MPTRNTKARAGVVDLVGQVGWGPLFATQVAAVEPVVPEMIQRDRRMEEVDIPSFPQVTAVGVPDEVGVVQAQEGVVEDHEDREAVVVRLSVQKEPPQLSTSIVWVPVSIHHINRTIPTPLRITSLTLVAWWLPPWNERVFRPGLPTNIMAGRAVVVVTGTNQIHVVVVALIPQLGDGSALVLVQQQLIKIPDMPIPTIPSWVNPQTLSILLLE